MTLTCRYTIAYRMFSKIPGVLIPSQRVDSRYVQHCVNLDLLLVP